VAVFPETRPVPIVPSSPTMRNDPVELTVPDMPPLVMWPPDTWSDRMLEAGQPAPITPVQVPSYLDVPTSVSLRRGDDRVCALGDGRLAGDTCRGASSPVIDLSVLPTTPPTEPAWPKASEPLASTIRMLRKDFVAAPRIRIL
jgi:hypothetical protein